MDRADQAAVAVAAEGMTLISKTTGTVHIRPEVKVEREQRMLFARSFGMLHLEWTATVDGSTVQHDDWEGDECTHSSPSWSCSGRPG